MIKENDEAAAVNDDSSQDGGPEGKEVLESEWGIRGREGQMPLATVVCWAVSERA